MKIVRTLGSALLAMIGINLACGNVAAALFLRYLP